MKLYAWHCAMCSTDAPGAGRPRYDNPCRICAECTLRERRIVRRVRMGPYGKMHRAARSLRDMTCAGLDLQAELDHLVGLELVPERLRERPPMLEITRLRRAPKRVVAFAYHDTHVIEVMTWPNVQPASLLQSLVHELAHFVSGLKHDQRFCSTMCELALDGYGVEPEFPPTPSGSLVERTYRDLDIALERGLASYLKGR